MKTILEEYYQPYFDMLGLFPAENTGYPKDCGLIYQIDPAIGDGYYWLYPIENRYSVAIYSLKFKTDFLIRYENKPCLMLGNYVFPKTEQSFRIDFMPTQSIFGYVSKQEDVFQMKINRGTIINSIVICFSQEFNREFFPKKFPGISPNLFTILSGIDENEIIPEITEVLRQICLFRPAKEIAKTYYESKIMEVLCFLIQWYKRQSLLSDHEEIPISDKDHLKEIAAYLDQHFTDSISLDSLAKIACMSQNKLTALFKKTYGSTITEYVQSLRVNRSKDMLLNSDWSVGAIANEVGYKLHSSFSEVFKNSTGLTPNKFRKNAL